MQEKKTNTNEPLTEQELKEVSGGVNVLASLLPYLKIKCKCGHTFCPPYNVTGIYYCPICREKITE